MLNAEREREIIMRVKMEMKTKGKGKLKIRVNKGKLISRLATLLSILVVTSICVGCAKYPEQYFTTWKYQLENDLAQGKQDAIEYYNNTYIANGKQLFDDKYMAEDEWLNMTTVVGYDITEDGVLLHTNDGNGYFIEK